MTKTKKKKKNGGKNIDNKQKQPTDHRANKQSVYIKMNTDKKHYDRI